MMGYREPDPAEAEAARLVCAILIAFLRNDPDTVNDVNTLSDDLAGVDLSDQDKWGVALQTSASLIDAICQVAKVDAIPTLRNLMGMINPDRPS